MVKKDKFINNRGRPRNIREYPDSNYSWDGRYIGDGYYGAVEEGVPNPLLGLSQDAIVEAIRLAMRS